jgi:hypothetical protein
MRKKIKKGKKVGTGKEGEKEAGYMLLPNRGLAEKSIN